MNRIWIVLASAVIMGAAACQQPKEPLHSRLQKSDRVEVEYYGPAHQATNPVVIVQRSEIDSLSKLVGEAENAERKCTTQGLIRFKKADSLIFSGEFELTSCGMIYFKEGETTQLHHLSAGAERRLKELEALNQSSKLDGLAWFIGRWTQTEGPDLVSYEHWRRASPTQFVGKAWTLYQMDTVHTEGIQLVLEGEDIYYVPTVKENKGPVRFKMTSLQGKMVVFENPEHDFPQKISYEAKGDSMLIAKISGSKGGGPEITKEFPLRRQVQ